MGTHRVRNEVKAGSGAHYRSKWPQIEPTTLADKVYQVIRSRIVHRELAPGTFIREQEVSRATGVSRTPVREALNRLASQDFLERVPHRGFRVPSHSWETILQIYPMITALDALAAKLAIERITPADLKRMREHNRALAAVPADGDERMRVEHNNAFHRIVTERSGNPKLLEQLAHLRAQVVLLDLWYFSRADHVRASCRDHEAMIDTLAARDLDATVALIAQHHTGGCELLREEADRLPQAV